MAYLLFAQGDVWIFREECWKFFFLSGRAVRKGFQAEDDSSFIVLFNILWKYLVENGEILIVKFSMNKLMEN